MNIDDIVKEVETGKRRFRELLLRAEESGGLTLKRYVGFLQFQYHLTKGVQRHFFAAASHPDLARRQNLRNFLVKFANEEECHYLLAEKDLQDLGADLGQSPFAIRLWWAYFSSIVVDRPFIRLGATCVLENFAEGSKDVIDRLTSKAPFLSERNTRFLLVHKHEELAHGDEVVKALEGSNLERHHFEDLVQGAQEGTELYLLGLTQALE